MFHFLDSLALMKSRCRVPGEMLSRAALQHVLLPKLCLNIWCFAPSLQGGALCISQMNHYPQSQQKIHRALIKAQSPLKFLSFPKHAGLCYGTSSIKLSISINNTFSISLFGCFWGEVSTSHQNLNISF